MFLRKGLHHIDIHVYMYSRKSMITVTNEVFKCFFLLTQKYFPDPVNDSFKDRGGYSLSIIIICNQMHYPTQNSIWCITFWTPKHALQPWWDPLHGIKKLYNVNPLILQSRPILQIFYLQKSPMLEKSICHCWWLWRINA